MNSVILSVLFACLWCSTVKSETLQIYPASIVVKTGHSVRFTAVAEESSLKNFTPDNCIWQATGGTIDDSGTFIAGSSTGTYQVNVFADGRSAEAEVVVVRDQSYAPVKLGSIFIRRWHFYPTKEPDKINMRISALTKGETVKTARVYLINPDGSEIKLCETKAHHNGRARFHAVFTPCQGQWIDIKTYDSMGRIMAHTRRMI